MKIVKRDGRTVDYDSSKIKTAIGKANNEVSKENQISEEEINDIIKYIEGIDKKRVLVEDIQDIIEEKLMEKGKFALAKKYIIYRYTRSIIRKSNTTDATILSLLKNSEYNSSNYLVANKQRDVMAGEASRDLAYRLLLPRNVVDSIKENSIEFCNVEYFTEPIIESVRIDLDKILSTGTNINGVKIEEPKSFQSAANVLVEVIASLASAQTGPIYIDFKDLFKYYYMSFQKYVNSYKAFLQKNISEEAIKATSRTQAFIEVASGIQTLLFQINTLTLAKGEVPKVYFLVNPKDAKNDIEEQIIYELIKQKNRGLKNIHKDLGKFPMIIYSVSEDMKYKYLQDEVVNGDFSTILVNEKSYKNIVESLGYFNQGSMIINVANIALRCILNTELSFEEELVKQMEVCYEGILCRNHNLQGVYSDKSPMHWINGGISKLNSGEKIDELLKKSYSYANLVVIGVEVAVKLLGDNSKKEFIIKTIQKMLKDWNSSSNFKICLSNYYENAIIEKLRKKDKELFKKDNLGSYYDSLDFQKSNYFNEGFLYYVFLADEKNLEEKVLQEDLLFLKI